MSTLSDLPSGVEWLHEGTEEEIDDDGCYASAQFYVPGAVREEFRRIVGGGVPEQFSIGGTSFTRVVPLKYDGFDNCYATGVSMRGEGRSSAPSDALGIQYDYWIARVKFATRPYRFDGSYPAVTESGDAGADMVTRPGTAYEFPSDSLVVSQNVGVLMPTIDFSLTFHQLPSLNVAGYAALAGRVNTEVFYGCAAGTVQYVGPSWQGQKTVGNVVSWDVTHKFRFRWIEHNKIMRPDGAGFEAPVQVGDATKYLLPTIDLNALWAL
jgi:hypothetical protein